MFDMSPGVYGRMATKLGRKVEDGPGQNIRELVAMARFTLS